MGLFVGLMTCLASWLPRLFDGFHFVRRIRRLLEQWWKWEEDVSKQLALIWIREIIDGSGITFRHWPRAIVAVALSGIKFFSRKRGKVNAAFLPLAIVSFFAVSDVALRDPLIHAIVDCNLLLLVMLHIDTTYKLHTYWTLWLWLVSR